MEYDRADRCIGGQLLGGIHQAFEHCLIECVVLISANHRHRCHTVGADSNTNSVFVHPGNLPWRRGVTSGPDVRTDSWLR